MNYVSLLLHMDNSKRPGPFTDLIEVSQQMACNSTGELDDTVVDDFLNNMNSIDYLLLCAIMSTKNDFINEKIKFVEKIPGEMHISYSRDTCVDDDDNTPHEAEVLNRINNSGASPHTAELPISYTLVPHHNFCCRIEVRFQIRDQLWNPQPKLRGTSYLFFFVKPQNMFV